MCLPFERLGQPRRVAPTILGISAFYHDSAADDRFDRALATAQGEIALDFAAQAGELVNSLRKQVELYKQKKSNGVFH